MNRFWSIGYVNNSRGIFSIRGGLAVFLWVFSASWVMGQTEEMHLAVPGFTRCTQYTSSDGLPSSEVHCLFRDHQGYFWIGTDQGLVRFDSEDMEVFTSLNGMPDNMVVGIKEDARGNIWLSSLNKKVFYIDSTREKVIVPEFNRKLDSLFMIFRVFDWSIDAQGNGAVGVSVKSMFKEYQSNRAISPNVLLQIEDFDLANVLKVPVNHSQFIEWLKNGKKFQFYNDTGFPVEDGEFRSITTDTIQYFSTAYSLPSWSTTRHTSAPEFLRLRDGRGVWAIGPRLLVVDADRTKVVAYKEFDTDVVELYEDGQERLWLGLNFQAGGLVFEKGAFDEGRSFLRGNTITSFLEEADDALWIGTREIGVLRFSNSIFSPIKLPRLAKVVNRLKKENGRVFSVFDGSMGMELTRQDGAWRWLPGVEGRNRLTDFWCRSDSCYITETGTNGYRLNLQTPNMGERTLVPVNGPNKFVFFDKSKVCGYSSISHWILDVNDLDYSYRGIDNKRSLRINNVVPRINGEVFLATSKGIRTARKATAAKFFEEFFKGVSVYDIIETNDSILWVATKGNGLYKVDMVSHEATIFTKADGLPQNSIYDIDLVGDAVYGATSSGLFRVSASSNSAAEANAIWTWNRTDGLYSDEIHAITSLDGYLILKSWNGLTSVSIEKLLALRTDLPVVLKKIRVENTGATEEEIQSLRADQNSLSFHFGSFHFGKKAQKYWYRLRDEGQWLSTNTNTLNLLDLQSGNYQLSISTSKRFVPGYSLWLPFTIKEPFTKTFTFFALVIGSIGLVLFAIFRVLFMRQKLITKILMSQQQALTSQMNPHFIFNALSSIQFFIGKGSKEMAQSYLSRFAQLIRQVLDGSTLSEVVLRKEIEGLKNYIELEELRFHGNITCKIKVTEELQYHLNEIAVPTMIIQPFIENAIIHGLHPKESLGKLDIVFSIEGDYLKVVVEDDGIGRAASKEKKKVDHKSHGMSITQQRISLLNKKAMRKIKIKTFDVVPSGTRVEIVIPIKVRI